MTCHEHVPQHLISLVTSQSDRVAYTPIWTERQKCTVKRFAADMSPRTGLQLIDMQGRTSSICGRPRREDPLLDPSFFGVAPVAPVSFGDLFISGDGDSHGTSIGTSIGTSRKPRVVPLALPAPEPEAVPVADVQGSADVAP